MPRPFRFLAQPFALAAGGEAGVPQMGATPETIEAAACSVLTIHRASLSSSESPALLEWEIERLALDIARQACL